MNRMSSHVLSYKSPLKVLSPSSPLFPLPPKTFGCICYLYVPKFNRTKLDPKALKCVFLSYKVDQKYYHPPILHKFMLKDVTFF